MAENKITITSDSKELSDVTLVQNDDLQIRAHSVVLGSIKSEDVSKEVTKSENDKQDHIAKIQVKYSLNKVKNLNVAKANASRPTKIERQDKCCNKNVPHKPIHPPPRWQENG